MDSAQPYRITKPELERILAELKVREPIFHHPELGTTRKDFENMIVPDYWEVGASGARYGKEFVLNELDKRYSSDYKDKWETSDFHLRELSTNLYLLTYDLLQDKTRKTRRSTIWQRTDSGWKILYHQGTILADNL